MKKYHLVIYNKEKKFYFTKYFDNKREKENYLRKIKYVKDLILIEDSEDIKYS